MAQTFTTELTEPHLTRLVSAIDELNSSRILLTGGTGFVGKWLIEMAKIAQDHSASQIELVVPTRDSNSPQARSTAEIGLKGLKLIQGDLLNDSLQLGNFDMIIHAATPASAELNFSNPAEMLRINQASMTSALKFAKNKTPFLFTSSGAVYGLQEQSVAHQPEGPTSFTEPLNQESAYGTGKRIAESLCQEAATHGICQPIIARLFTFSGKYLPRDTHFAIGNFVQNAIDHKPILINSDGLSRRSYLYGADMATWLWCALANKTLTDPIHVGSEKSISIRELAETVADVSEKVLDFRPEIHITKTSADEKTFHQYVPSIEKTRKLLAIAEWTSLETSITLMLTQANN